MFEDPRFLSVVSILITIVIFICGMIATVFMTVISFAIKTTLKSIDVKIVSLETKLDGFGDHLEKTDSKIDDINEKLHQRISGTDNEVTKITREFGESIVRIEGMIKGLKVEFRTNLMTSPLETKH